MIRKLGLIALLTLLVSVGVAQNQQTSGQATPVNTTQITLPVYTLNPAPASGANLAIIGNPGHQTIYYWISANYPVGSASLAGPYPITQAPGTLSASHYVTVNPTLPGGVTSYDVLKTSTPLQPSGACACAVATGVTPGAVTNDQSNSTSAYTVNPINVNALGMTLANEVQSSGVSHLILRQNGVQVADLSTAGGGVAGSGTAATIPLWSSGTALGNSNMQVVTGGVQYALGSGLSWQVNASGLSWNSGVSGSGNIVLQNTYPAGANNQAGGIILEGAPSTGEACAGAAELLGGGNGSTTGATVQAGGTCANGIGTTGAPVYITAGSTSAGNTGGSIYLQPGTGGYGNGSVQVLGNQVITGALSVSGSITQTGGGPTQWSGNAQTGAVTVPGGSDFSLFVNSSDQLNCQLSTALGGAPCLQSIPAGVTYAPPSLTPYYWTQTIASGAQNLTAGTPATVTLAAGHVGIDVTTGMYSVLLNDANLEAVNVTGGTYTKASGGAITFTPFFSHGSSASYTIGSASSGLQETVNQACGTSATSWHNTHCNVTIPASGPGASDSINSYNVYGTLYWHANDSTLTAGGAVLNCLGRGACLQVGDQVSSNDYANNTIRDLLFRAPTPIGSLSSAYQGVLVTNTVSNGSYLTITTAAAHNFRPGDMVTVLFTDDAHYWGDLAVYDCGSGSSAAACTGSSTTFRAPYSYTISSQATPGVVALAYVAVLDNAENTKFDGLGYATGSNYGDFNNWFDVWDDENTTVEKFNNNGGLNHSATWTGSFVFAGSAKGHVTAPVINIKDSNFTAAGANCVTDYANNGLYVDNSVCQGSSLWGFHASLDTTGIGKGIFLRNIYSENAATNNASPQWTPYYGLGQAGLILGSLSVYATAQISGQAGMNGAFPSGGSGSVGYSYYIVVNDVTAGTHSAPLYIYSYASTGSDSPVVNWPRVANAADVITYDVIRTGSNAPYTGGCGGGSTTACGSVTTALAQAAACTVNGGLICTFTDTASASTSAYSVNVGNYAGTLAFWPGQIVSVNHSVRVDQEQGGGVGVGLAGDPLQIAGVCDGGGDANSGGYTSCLSTPVFAVGPGPAANLPATVMMDAWQSGSFPSNVTGRLLFSSNPAYPYQEGHHIITLLDSNPGLTLATQGYRRPASGSDGWIGTDAPRATSATNTHFAIGAGYSISGYIGVNSNFSTTDGTEADNWLFRLTSSMWTWKVPQTTNQQITSTVTTGTAPFVVASTTPVANLVAGGNVPLAGGTMTGQLNTPATNGVCVGTACLSGTATGALVTGGVINGAGTGTLTTTGATLLVAILSGGTSSTPSFSDSLGNTWNALTPCSISGNNYYGGMVYAYSHSGGALAVGSDTFTLGSGTYSSQAVIYAFSGTPASAVLSAQSCSGAKNLQAGSITPSGGDIVVAGFSSTYQGLCGSCGGTIGLTGFSTALVSNPPASTNSNAAGVYLLNASNSAINPTWSILTGGGTMNTNGVPMIASFKTNAATAVAALQVTSLGAGVAQTDSSGNVKSSATLPAGLTIPGYSSSLSIPTGTATFAAGTNVTSVGCATGYSCNNTRGTLTIVGGTATTGTIATVSFSATLSAAPSCLVDMNGGTVWYGIGNGAPSTSSFTITAGVSVSGATFNVNYVCQP